MASAAAVLSNEQFYFCHQCNRTVSLTPPPSLNSDLSCPVCRGGFLEESLPPPPPSPSPFPDSFFPFLDPSSTGPLTRPGPGPGPVVFSTTFVRRMPPNPDSLFDVRALLEAYVASMAAGAPLQFVLDDGTINLGDYAFGPGALEQLIQQIAENDPNRYGTPPAAKTAVEGLPTVVVGEEVVKSEANACAVCMTEYEVGNEVKQMPCNHLFHDECILPWLQLHNSCPVCRFELPTDDQDYETRKSGGGGGDGDGNGNGSGGGRGGGGEGSGSGSAESPSGGMFNISVPSWFPNVFRGGRDDNNGGSSGGSQQTSYESLD